jgi:hypothetical protein
METESRVQRHPQDFQLRLCGFIGGEFFMQNAAVSAFRVHRRALGGRYLAVL